VFLSVIVALEYLNFSGFCYSKKRYLSDDEFFAIAIKNNLDRHSPDSRRSKMYASLEEFYRENPKCCEIMRWNTGFAGSSLVLRFFGVYDVLVDIVYRINDGGGVDNFYGSDTTINSCGTVLGVFGQSMAENLKDRK
jgi:hypothetical protein